MHIQALPAQARPREKLLERGPQALSDVELLALLLRTGTAGKPVLTLAEELLAAGGVAGLLNASRVHLQRFKGLGPAKQAELLAVAELARTQDPQVMKTLKVPNLSEQLGSITCPALTFWGLNEQMMPDSGILKLAKGLRHGRMVLVPQCGHWVMIEHRELFNRLMLDFLREG